MIIYEQSLFLLRWEYVIEFAKKWRVIGYDINEEIINNCINADKSIRDISPKTINSSCVEFTTNETDLKLADILIVTVPTPVASDKLPDLSCVKDASKIVGRNLKKGAIVVYESTVFPGTTNDICVPILEKESGYIRGKDFEVGYSPERINVSDALHTIKNIIKIVASDNKECLSFLRELYGSIVGHVYECDSIAVAEGAKIVENCQRDLNIAFMNEMLLAFRAMNIDFDKVLSAASTKWNFVKCNPGLVGGHCIGVDSYYMLYKAQESGIDMSLLKTTRSINENMLNVHFQKIKETILSAQISEVKAAYLGGTFKEDCSDTRNSKNLELFELLKSEFENLVLVDPYIQDKNVVTTDMKNINDINVLIIGAGHTVFEEFLKKNLKKIFDHNSEKYIFDFSLFFKRKHINKEGYKYITL